jgi:macrolide-specific efflux system membrane fusion protein
MTQMTAQVFFVIDAAYDVLRVPVGAVRYAPRGEAARSADGESERMSSSESAPRSPQPQRGSEEGRAATVIVINADGEEEERSIVTGASDRIHVEVISGLEEGDEVMVLAQAREAPQRNNNNNNRFGGGFGPPMGGLP